ncbi:BZ3500_MvSof-1268-A1-R1_Chr12-2g03851 [Microbotryum saponariae]|uniref:BZ3500_MvSof-1268-A1-R1_Chr12-2g03851 protein n=1 Tax=Microbotryum saponariae TaxID=289078 RepID=A0A2X0KQI2_9BASI|nr:BZ3500_MvSof-1268-A1-R1_Chr12-2g03851 [Microbotryum saponariae]
MDRFDPSQLPRQLLHLSTLQLVAQAAPSFTHARSLPIHTLSDLLQDYLGLLASSAKARAELAGRDKVAVWDIGATIDEFGVGPIYELKDEAMKPGSPPTEDGGLRIPEVAHELAEHLDVRLPLPPIAQLAYDVLHPIELHTLHHLPDLMPSSIDSPPSDDSELEISPRRVKASTSPVKNGHRSNPSFTLVKQEPDVGHSLFLDAWDQDPAFDLEKEIDMLNLPMLGRGGMYAAAEEEQEPVDEDPALAWRDPSLIPPWVPDFLPPFPGMERQREAPLAARSRREQADSAWDGRPRGAQYAAGGDPWSAPIPYNTSMLSDMHPISHLPPLSPHPLSPTMEEDEPLLPRPTKRRRRAVSPLPSALDSLDAYRTALPEISHMPTYRRPNLDRRRAAAVIGLHPDLSIAGVDSLFGLLPMPWTRQPIRPPGYLPETATTAAIHPFNTALPHTATVPVPYHQGATGTHLAAPVPHPRVPTTLARAKDQLFKPSETNNNLAIYSRLTRIGPPGPLGPKGEALDYEYVGQTSIIALNVDWPVRRHDQRLPVRDDEGLGSGTVGGIGSVGGTGGASTPAASGIKLKLGRAGSASVVGSPAPATMPTPGPSTGTWLGGFASNGPPSASATPAYLSRADSPLLTVHRDSITSMGGGGVRYPSMSREASVASLPQEVADMLVANGIPLDQLESTALNLVDQAMTTSTNDLFNQIANDQSAAQFDASLFGFGNASGAFDPISSDGLLSGGEELKPPVGPISFKFPNKDDRGSGAGASTSTGH